LKDVSSYLTTFIAEAQENLENLNQSLLGWEQNPERIDLLAEMFRSVHTIKGGSASLGYEKIAELCHEMENLLEKLRGQKIRPNSQRIDILFKSFDTLSLMVEEVIKGKGKGINLPPLLNRLRSIQKKEAAEGVVTEIKLHEIEEERSAPKLPEPGKAQTVRVAIQRLDTLMNLVGELIIDKFRLTQVISHYEIPELKETIVHLERLINELQDEIMQARLIPIERIFSRFPRLVRDLSKKRDKKINLVIEGSEIEVDRTILDEISNPLLHLLRNAIDHGIETPEERKSSGKSPSGLVKLAASRRRNTIFIEVSDDGRGLNPQAIRALAIKKGVITTEEAAKLTDKEALILICRPGFTTSQNVTKVSGRGVGLDVVKTTIEFLGGTVIVDSKVGIGSKFTLNLPLTMAVIPAILVTLDNNIYAIPSSNVIEIVSLFPSDIKRMGDEEVIKLREEVIPLVRLTKVLGFPSKLEDEQKEFPVVVVEAGARRAGLVVDSLAGQQEIVVKPLGNLLKDTKGYAGATSLGDGKVTFILDIANLIQ
jgi:two-component system chemotaxis sensor kinase CheA